MQQELNQKELKPSPYVRALLTDLYQLTMTASYYTTNMGQTDASFDLFFRSCPFKGEFTVFAGLDECVHFLKTFSFTDDDIEYLKTIMTGLDPEFFDWLKSIDPTMIEFRSMQHGTICFPYEPLITVSGPLAVCQIIETTLLNLVNFSSLIATNACRHRLLAGEEKVLMEFGLRRAQGPAGAMFASKYSIVGGFDGTSNVQAGKDFNLKTVGTHAHSYVTAFTCLDDVNEAAITKFNKKNNVDFVQSVLAHRERLGFTHTNDGELAAFISYGITFPDGFLALVDTYDTILSGVPNFLCVACALHDLGYFPLGIRLDSGDLAQLSKDARELYKKVFPDPEFHTKMRIIASNDICEEALREMNKAGHEIDVFGIGTHLVTCKACPALGGVYKLVAIHGEPRIKLSENWAKTSIPGKKNLYRLFNDEGKAFADIICTGDEELQLGEGLYYATHNHEDVHTINVKDHVNLLTYTNELGGFPEIEPYTETRNKVIEQTKNFAVDCFVDGVEKYPVLLSQKAKDLMTYLAEKERARLE
ncbi:hypothetical protein PCE1_002869 [Barthelona sp. PCE]